MSELWTCYTCHCASEPDENGKGEACCPHCGAVEGDGYGMAENDHSPAHVEQCIRRVAVGSD